MADNEKVTLGADGAELSFTKRYDAPLVGKPSIAFLSGSTVDTQGIS